MIQYYKSAFGLKLLLRVGGSAVYRSFIPGFLAVCITILTRRVWAAPGKSFDEEFNHPYAVGVLISSLTFLLVFRVQQGYARYWEATTMTHQFLSKWMDASMHCAAFHMQCSHYDNIKPPSYFDYRDLNRAFLTRVRERFHDHDQSESQRLHNRAVGKSIEQVTDSCHSQHRSKKEAVRRGSKRMTMDRSNSAMHLNYSGMKDPTPLESQPRLDGGWGSMFPDGKATFFNPMEPTKNDLCGFSGIQGGLTPPLFLQELAHLTSLLSAVALSTLRNDIEGAESPLDIYEPGSPWPAVDPQRDHNHPRGHGFRFTWFQKIKFFIGNARTPEERTKYNATRPMPVIGGVSDAEIRFLQLSRGPSAKVQLCWFWLSEFITREHLAGSFGEVGSPMVSRVVQFMGDGMLFYNNARKIMFIPFPFPHAQLSVVYVLVAIPAIAVMHEEYATDLWVACILSFLTVTCLSGIHEVARELENPFRNIPNELPLVTMQAQFNEALLGIYSGYHPDHFWKEEAEDYYDAMPNARPEQSSETKYNGISSTDGSAFDTKAFLAEMQIEILAQKEALEKQNREIERLQNELKHRGSAGASNWHSERK